LKVKSKVIILGVIFCMLFSLTGMASAATDISNHWARETIEQCLSDGIVSGMPDGSFQPNKNITRAEIATMVNKAFEFKDADTDKTFSDVKADAWYDEQVAIAAKAGYITGFPDGTFQPQKQCTRAEACVMIRKAAGMAEGLESALNIFKDSSSVPAFAKGSVSALVSENLIKGYPDGTFGPQAQITRAESLVMVYRTSTGDHGETVRVTGVELDKTSITVSVDSTTRLKATVKPADAANKKVEWTTSNKEIATVDDDGLVKGIKAGKATVTVTTEDGEKTATCSVNVTSGSSGGGGGSSVAPVKKVANIDMDVTPFMGGISFVDVKVNSSTVTGAVKWKTDKSTTVRNIGEDLRITADDGGSFMLSILDDSDTVIATAVVAVADVTAKDIVVELEKVPPVDVLKANIDMDVTPFMGGISFVDVKVNSSTVTGAVKWKTDKSTTVRNIGEDLRITADDGGSFMLSILDDSDTVIATAVVAVADVTAKDIVVELERVPPVDVLKANIDMDVTPFMGGISFVDVKVNSSTVTGAVKWKTDKSTTVRNIGEDLRITADDGGSFMLSILDDSDTVIATAVVAVADVTAKDIVVELERVPPVDVLKANIDMDVTPFMGGISFVDVKVNSSTVTGAVKWKTDKSTTVRNIGEDLRITADDGGSFMLSILDDSDMVLANAEVAVANVINKDVTLQK
jgi:hypothetical protein